MASRNSGSFSSQKSLTKSSVFKGCDRHETGSHKIILNNASDWMKIIYAIFPVIFFKIFLAT